MASGVDVHDLLTSGEDLDCMFERRGTVARHISAYTSRLSPAHSPGCRGLNMDRSHSFSRRAETDRASLFVVSDEGTIQFDPSGAVRRPDLPT